MFSWIAKAYDWATGKIDGTIAGWVHDVISGLWGFLHSLFGGIIDAWNDLYNDAKHLADGIESLGKEVYGWIAWFLHDFWHAWIAWVTKHILDPLIGAVKWIAHEGSIIWHYISHPADLVDLIFDPLIAKIEAEAWDIGGKLGKFFLSLIIKNVAQFARLIEDIIDAVF